MFAIRQMIASDVFEIQPFYKENVVNEENIQELVTHLYCAACNYISICLNLKILHSN